MRLDAYNVLMKSLRISKEISLPVDIVTQTIAILAKRRAGKSYTMRRLAEELLKANQQIILVDPKGDQWGIRSSADGKRPGYPIVILGGEHGDAPLESSAGEVVAKLVVEERVSILLDLSAFRKHEIASFMAIFLENLYRLKAQEIYRTPCMLIIDEADAIAPQRPQKGEERMLGAAEDIVRRGGQRGIGCALITQRSAVLNKNVLTQAQMLIVLRTIAPQDLAAMKAWIDVHGSLEEGKTLMESLPSLPIGDAWFWSPGWPTTEGIFARSHILPIETFDSGATPTPGTKPVVPKNLADVDLEVLKKQMAATIEKAKNDDPKVLRKRIMELEDEAKNLSKMPKIVSISDKPTNPMGVSQWKEYGKKYNYWDFFEKQIVSANDKEWRTVVKSWKSFAGRMMAGIEIFKQMDISQIPPDAPIAVITNPHKSGENFPPHEELGAVTHPYTTKDLEPIEWDGTASNPEQRILDGIAWMTTLGVKNPVSEIVAFLAGYAHSMSKGFTNPRSSLNQKGLIFYPSPGKLALTDEGLLLAHFPDQPGTVEELHKIILDRLDHPKQRILRPLLKAYPNDLSGEELAEAAGYSHQMSKGYTNPRSALRSFGLIEYPGPGIVRAADILFPNI